MAEELGQYQRLYVANAASPFTYTYIAGQRTLTKESQSNMINTSSKTSSVYGQRAPGRADLTITCAGVMALPDAAGIERVYTLFLTQAAGLFRIMKTLTSPALVKFAASMFVSNWQEGMNDQEEATYSFNLTMAGAAPTVDDLTP